MNMNLKVTLSVALAAVATAPAAAKFHPRQRAAPVLYTAAALAHSNHTVLQAQGNRMLGTDPDPQVRLEMKRDGNSSWESMGGGGGSGGGGGGGGAAAGGR
jgi:hypothetical protein